jgi:RNA polymerase sigma-70 factor (ECF subfamily)
VDVHVLRLLDFTRRQPQRLPAEPAPDADDVALVARLALDDGQALAALMDRYWRPMVAFALDKMRNQDAAEDLVQEAFVRVWERRRQLRPHASPRAYLYRVLRNLITDDFRRRRLRDRFSFFASQGAPTEAPSPVAILEAGELAGAAERAIAALPERRRDVFILAHLHGLSYREVAETLGITPRTVANHMTLALSQLRVALAAFTRPSGRGEARELPMMRLRDGQRGDAGAPADLTADPTADPRSGRPANDGADVSLDVSVDAAVDESADAATPARRRRPWTSEPSAPPG